MKIYLIKAKSNNAGWTILKKEWLGRKVKLNMISPPLEERRKGCMTLEKALKKEYRIVKMGCGAGIQTPSVLIGARVEIEFVN